MNASSVGYKSNWAQIKVSLGLHSLREALGKGKGLFQLLGATHIPWLVAHSFHLRSQQHCISQRSLL